MGDDRTPPGDVPAPAGEGPESANGVPAAVGEDPESGSVAPAAVVEGLESANGVPATVGEDPERAGGPRVTAAGDRKLVDRVRAALRGAADPAKAEPMRAYMKSAMPFLGVPTPARTAALRPVLTAHPLRDAPTWRASVLVLWREATHREERYAALTVARRYPRLLVAEPEPSLAMLDELVVTGAWWDLVDETAIRLVGPLLLAHPDVVEPAMRRWARDPDRWRRRTAVICQIGAKDRVDTALLADAIEANAGDPDFFLRKGIGWALRQHARVDPGWVRTFTAGHDLSPLSRREALKHL